MVSQRELQNIGRLKQDEQDLAISRTRQKRTSRVAPKYTFDYQEEEAADLAVAEEPASHKRKRSSNAPVKITFKVEKPKRRRRSTASKPVPSLDGNNPKSAPRKRSIQAAESVITTSPKRRKITASDSCFVGDTSTKVDDTGTNQTPTTPRRRSQRQPKILITPDTESDLSSQDAKAIVLPSSTGASVSDLALSPSNRAVKAPRQHGRTLFTLPKGAHSDQFRDLSSAKLEVLADQLAQRTKRIEKPKPTGQPLVWAESRRELCEALPYYRSYKAGGYHSQGIAHAFMFNDTGHPRDYLDSSVVIARSGGGMAKEEKNGPMLPVRDQETSAQILSLHRNMAEYRPVGVIAGGQHTGIQSKMSHAYQFLDWFKPTDVWCQKQNKHVIVRYRFEKLRLQEPSWWTPKGETDELLEISKHVEELVPLQSPCQSCSMASLQVYLNGWMCLYPTCSNFWTFTNNQIPVEEELKYDPRFLKRRTHWPHSSTPWETRPNPFNLSATGVAGETHMEVFGELTKSIVCPQCGRCTAAKFWTYWLCGNDQCRLRAPLPRMSLQKAALRELTYPISNGYSFPKDIYDSTIKVDVLFIGNYRVHKYTLPGVPGFVAHMMANKQIVEETCGPDEMFMDLQDNDIGLERRAKDDTRINGENLCDHYTLNFGMPYKFVATPDSKPFSDAPKSVAMARSQLNWASRALDITNEPDFNELMVLGYKSANKIGFHDDGEEGLGPTVATLSIGSPAEMKLKMQEKYFRGFTGVKEEQKTKTFTDKLPPIPGGNKWEQRLTAYHDLTKLKEMDKTAYMAKKKALPHELAFIGQGNKTGAPEVLKMRLAHGDIVVMHGALVQAYYLHCVEPKGSLRFAFTCRNILANHLKEDELPSYEVEPDEIKYDGFKLPLPK